MLHRTDTQPLLTIQRRAPDAAFRPRGLPHLPRRAPAARASRPGPSAACGVTTSGVRRAVAILHERDGLSNAQLARRTLVTPQAMSLVISALDRRRLVRRRPDPNHRRALRVSVTARGRGVLAQCDRAMDAIESDMLAGLDPHTIEAVRTALTSCAHALESAARAGRGL